MNKHNKAILITGVCFLVSGALAFVWPILFLVMFLLMFVIFIIVADREDKREKARNEEISSGQPFKAFRTSLVQADFHQRPCKVYVCENETVVVSKGSHDVHIPYSKINVLLFQDKTKTDENLAGFSIDYDRNTRRVMFADTSASDLRKIIDAIRSAHYKLTNGEVGFLKLIDVGEMEKQAAREVVHKLV